MKIVSVVGTRPQYIKAAAITNAVGSFPGIDHAWLNTGQHYDHSLAAGMTGSLSMGAPVSDLKVGSDTHSMMTAKLLSAISQSLSTLMPDWVLNYGDTNTTLATALACAQLGIKSAHVESGMRRYDLSIPEEINRRVTDHLSTVLFASTPAYESNLSREAVPGKIFVTGDITYDTFKRVESLQPESVRGDKYIVCTLHRPHNVDEASKLRKILDELGRYGAKVVFPEHPRVKARMNEFGFGYPNNFHVIEPVTLSEMVALLRDSDFVVTDSGGLQKDAFFAKKPAVVINTDSPWIELKELGSVGLFEADNFDMDEAQRWAEQCDADFYARPFGDGTAAINILKFLIGQEQ